MRFSALPAAFLLASAAASGQVVPDVLYYKFNEGAGTTTLNHAVPGGGSATATLTGGLGFAPGQYGSGLSGAGGASSTNYVQTGYTMNLQGVSWAIEFWWQPNAGTSLQYLCGVPVSGDFRIFAGGSPGNNIVLSGQGITTVIATAAVPQPGVWVHSAFVFDSSAAPPAITPYINGLPGTPVAQTGSPVLSGGIFIVGGQTSNGLNGVLDEFRLWRQFRTPAEILANYNVELANENVLSASNSGPGVGDLTLSLASISPGAVSGFTLITGETAGAPGTGPVFGIVPDALTWQGFMMAPFPGNPFHFPVGPAGVYPAAPFVAPPGALASLAGQTFDLVAIVLGPGVSYLGKSAVVRITW